VVSWKLTDTMQVSWFSNLARDDSAVADFNDASTPSIDDINTVIDTTPEDTVTEVVPEDTTEAEDVTEVVEIKDVSFTVDPGSPGYKIATNLEAEGLIDSVDSFIQKLDEMNLGNKLRAGNFKLNTGMNVEEIINVIAGQ